MKTKQKTQLDIFSDKAVKGKTKQIYIKSDVEDRAKRFCEKENVSFSLLIRNALEEKLEREGF